jgi:diguanylate cyclase (GGDEF)-like protein
MDKSFIKDINILYVEDEDEVRTLTVEVLKNFVKSVIPAENGKVGLELFEKYNCDDSMPSFDLIVTDINMPKMGGLEMLKAIGDIDTSIPSIVTTAHNDAEFLKEAINQRVRGYVSKPLNIHDLIENIAIAVESQYLKAKLELANKQLAFEVEQKTKELQVAIAQLEERNTVLTYQATHDNLTSLSNRQKLNDELDKEILREKRYKHGLSLLMLDIDNFKSVNDTYGHDVGDIVLIELAKILKASIRETDIAARWGGEEFMVLLPETLMSDGVKIAQVIREKVENFDFEGVPHKITISIGATHFNVGVDTKDNFIKNADIGLYEAKHNGKNQVVIHEE